MRDVWFFLYFFVIIVVAIHFGCCCFFCASNGNLFPYTNTDTHLHSWNWPTGSYMCVHKLNPNPTFISLSLACSFIHAKCAVIIQSRDKCLNAVNISYWIWFIHIHTLTSGILLCFESCDGWYFTTITASGAATIAAAVPSSRLYHAAKADFFSTHRNGPLY